MADDRPARAEVSERLFEVHEAAMDAANDPSQARIREVQKAVRKLERQLPAFYAEENRRLMERAKQEA